MRAAPRTPNRAAGKFNFTFNNEGGIKFGRLTREHTPLDDGAFKYKLAIVLDNVVQTVADIISVINDRGRITGDFTKQEVDDIADIINGGSLPAAL